jgi:competence protein ComEC
MEALLIGKKTSLSPEIMTDFRRTGAVHILAVSGLHVGILAGIIQFILGLLPFYHQTGKVISAAFFILFLLSFAWLTHFEPAIVRAVGGTILMILAKSFQKTANAWNNLFAMACFLLFWDPNYLFHIGFQLSFIAVAGILAFYKSWVNSLQFKSRLLTYFWEMSVMGFAAQWVTLPFLLFHFNQFSWLFLITGWIAIPLSTFILGVGLLYLSISSLPIINQLIGWILAWSIHIFRWVMSLLSQLSWAVTEGIYLSFPAILLLMIVVLSLALALKYRKRNLIVISLCLLVSLFHFSSVFSKMTMKDIYLLSERKNAILTVRKGHSFYVFSKKPVEKNRQDLRYLGQWAKDIYYQNIPDKTVSFNFQSRELLILDGDISRDFLPMGTHWWVVHAVKMDWESCLSACPPKVLILNANLPVSYKLNLSILAARYGVEVFDIYKSGAYHLLNT